MPWVEPTTHAAPLDERSRNATPPRPPGPRACTLESRTDRRRRGAGGNDMKIRFAFGVIAAGLAFGAAADSFVELTNESAWAIHELYVSTVSDEEWGPDQLREQTIETGGTFRLSGIPCDDYDVRIVDEDGDACI